MGSRISDLMLRVGDAQANQALARGQGRAATIGALAGYLPGVQKRRADEAMVAESAQDRALDREYKTAQMEKIGGETRDAEMNRERAARITEIFAAEGDLPAKLTQLQQVDPEFALKLQKSFFDVSEAERRAALAQSVPVAQLAGAVMQEKDPARQSALWARGISALQAKGVIAPGEINQVLDPDALSYYFTIGRTVEDIHKSMQPPTLMQVDPTKDLANPQTGEVVRPGVPESKKYQVTVPSPNGPVARLVTEEEMLQGVREYKAPTQPRDERLVQIMGPQGTPIWVRESQAVNQPAAQAPRAVTGQERQVLAYYNRAKSASDTISTPDAKDGTSLEDRVSKSGLGTQLGLQYAPNLLQTGEQQRYRQAQRAFTEARLRKESGAAIPTAEYENDAKTYFAQPGDDPETVEQKRQERQVVLDGLKFSAGRAYQEFYGDDGGSPRTQQPQAPAAPSAPTVGSTVTFQGKRYRVKAIRNGQAELEPVN